MMAFTKLGAALIAGVVMPAVASAEPIKIRQTVPKAGVETDISYPRIVVDGQGTDKYDAVVTKTLDSWITVSGDKPGNASKGGASELKIETGRISIATPGAATVYKISFPYRAPKSSSVANMRVSPVDLCNARLAKLTGAARAKFLKEGDLFNYPDAWTATGSVAWNVKKMKGIFRIQESLNTFSDSAPVATAIECRALDRPKVRTTTTTSAGGAGPRAKKMDPAQSGQASAPQRTGPTPQRVGSTPQRTGPTPQRVAAGPPVEEFDARIRRVDRDGPNGATQLWVYNSGPATAVGCTIEARADAAAEFEQVASVADVGAQQTVKLPDTLPTEANEFLVVCPYEPEAAQANNSWVLDQSN